MDAEVSVRTSVLLCSWVFWFWARLSFAHFPVFYSFQNIYVNDSFLNYIYKHVRCLRWYYMTRWLYLYVNKHQIKLKIFFKLYYPNRQRWIWWGSHQDKIPSIPMSRDSNRQSPSNHCQLTSVWETEAVDRSITATNKSGPRPPWTGAEGPRSNYTSIDAHTCYQNGATQCTENARPKRSPTSMTWAILDTLEMCTRVQTA